MSDVVEATGEPVAAPPQDPPPTATAPARTSQRLQFLDAVRGIAAITVAIQHFVEHVSPGYLEWSHEVFRPGEWGVILFFVSSGFIIPVSIERYRSVGRFWIGRFFRLYPLYWAVTLGAVALYLLDRYGLSPELRSHWVRGTAANATMAQEFIGQPHVLGQAWTLAYELVFYFLVSLLFLVGWYRRPGSVLGVGLVGALVVGAGTPRLLTDGTDSQQVRVVVACGAVGLVAAVLARRSVGSALAAAGFAVAIVALVANRAHPAWFTLLLLSSMFMGWVLHRWNAGEVSGAHAALAVVATSAAVIAAHGLHFQVNNIPGTDVFTSSRAEIATFLGAYAVFLGAVALRSHSFPSPLRWLGEVSYSVYLVHGVVLVAVPSVGGAVTTVAVWLAVTLAVSWVTYRLFERPFQEWGRRVARRVASNAR